MSFVDLSFEPKEARAHLLAWRIPEAIAAYGDAMAKSTDPLELQFLQHRVAQAHLRTFDIEASLAQSTAAIADVSYGEVVSSEPVLRAMELMTKALAENITEYSNYLLWNEVVPLLEQAMAEAASPSDELLCEYLEALFMSACRGSRDSLAKAKLTLSLLKSRPAISRDLYLGLIDLAESELFMRSSPEVSFHLVAAQQADRGSHSLRALLAEAHCDAAILQRRAGLGDGISAFRDGLVMIREVVATVPGVVSGHRILARIGGHLAGALSSIDPVEGENLLGEVRRHFDKLAAAHPANPRVWKMLSVLMGCYFAEREEFAIAGVHALQARLVKRGLRPLVTEFGVTGGGDEFPWSYGPVTELLVTE